jgi:hypothetical protein
MRLHADAAQVPTGSVYSGWTGRQWGPGKFVAYGNRGALVSVGGGAIRTARIGHDNVVRLGADDSYLRVRSTETFTPPYTYGGEVVIHGRQSDPLIVDENRKPTWNWAFNLYPAMLDDDHNVVMGVAHHTARDRPSSGFEWGKKADGSKNYYNVWDSRWWGKSPVIQFGKRYQYRVEVPTYGHFRWFWADELILDKRSNDPLFRRPMHVGMRADFFDLTLFDTYVSGTVKPPTEVDDMFVPVNKRAFDTRSQGGKRAGGTTTTIPMPSEVPAGAKAVVVNITMTETDGFGYITAWPGGTRPNTSVNNSYAKNQVVPNLCVVELRNRSFQLYNHGGCQFFVDVQGYWA